MMTTMMMMMTIMMMMKMMTMSLRIRADVSGFDPGQKHIGETIFHYIFAS